MNTKTKNYNETFKEVFQNLPEYQAELDRLAVKKLHKKFPDEGILESDTLEEAIKKVSKTFKNVLEHLPKYQSKMENLAVKKLQEEHPDAGILSTDDLLEAGKKAGKSNFEIKKLKSHVEYRTPKGREKRVHKKKRVKSDPISILLPEEETKADIFFNDKGQGVEDILRLLVKRIFLRSLNETPRKEIELWIEGFNVKEIAKKTSRSPAAVEKSIQRSWKKTEVEESKSKKKNCPTCKKQHSNTSGLYKDYFCSTECFRRRVKMK